MKWWIIALIVVGGLVFLFSMFMLFVGLSNKSKKKRLQANLEKVQQQKEDLEERQKVVLDDSDKQTKETEMPQEVQELFEEASIEDLFDQEIKDTELKIEELEDTFEKNKKPDDFEDFLNENAFSRKVLDQNLLNKLKSMPPQMQSIILNSIFNKFDD